MRNAIANTKELPVVVDEGEYTLDENRFPKYGISILTAKNGVFVPLE